MGAEVKPGSARKRVEILNYRPVAYAATALATGILFAAIFRDSGIGMLCVTVAAFAAAVFAFIRKMRVLRIVATAVFAGIILFFVSFNAGSVTPGYAENAYIEGRVCAVTSYGDGYSLYTVEDLGVNGEGVAKKASVKSSEKLETGDLVAIYGNIESFELDPFDPYSMSYYRKDVRHKVEAVAVSVEGKSDLKFFELIRVTLADRFTTYMGEDAGALALGLTVGDKAFIDYDTEEAVRASGLSHLLAVSGLHVGFLSGIVYFFLRLLRRPKTSALLAVALVLLGYGFVTGFPAGVVRAAVTSICFLYALKKEERFDSVNALSLSVIVLLAAAPMSLFDIGFLMSVSAVLGILAFYTAIRKCFYSEGKLASFLASSVAVSLSANTLLIGISASVFGTFALYFVIANVIAVPYISLIYFFLVPISLFALIIPPIGYLLVPFKYLLQGFIYFSQFISALPFATLEVRVSSAVAAVYSLAVLFVSKFNLLPKKVKIAYAGVSGAVIALLIVL